MSLLNSLIGNGSSPSYGDKEIAEDILKDSKYMISALAKASLETVNPELRKTVDTELTEDINQHHLLADMMVKKSWYDVQDKPELLFKDDITKAENLLGVEK